MFIVYTKSLQLTEFRYNSTVETADYKTVSIC